MQMKQPSYTNQYPDPDDSVDQSVAETSFDFSILQIESNSKSKTEQLLSESPENDDSVGQSEAEITVGFNRLQIEANDDSQLEPIIHELSEIDASVDKSAAETSFDFSSLQIDADYKSKTERLMPESSENDDSVDQSAAEISVGFNHLQIETTHDSQSPETVDEDDDDEEDDDEDNDEGDFTFMCLGENDSPTTELFESGQIRFPLFDQSLLSTGDKRLPITVPVDNVFIESPRRSNGETAGVSAGTFCAISKDSDTCSPEINIKSNSTGFSKLWRFRDNMNRSNSDGRDAFVFFQSPDNNRATSSTSSTSNEKVNGVDGVDGKGNGKVTEKAVKRGKKKVKSAHEVYLKQKGGKTEDERRRSYLPYRPGLMGFFTNVNGGLSKNVHPF